MHTSDRAIKIIKREDRAPVPEDAAEPVLKTDIQVRREILTTITSWIDQQREAQRELQRQSVAFKRETYANS